MARGLIWIWNVCQDEGHDEEDTDEDEIPDRELECLSHETKNGVVDDEIEWNDEKEHPEICCTEADAQYDGDKEAKDMRKVFGPFISAFYTSRIFSGRVFDVKTIEGGSDTEDGDFDHGGDESSHERAIFEEGVIDHDVMWVDMMHEEIIDGVSDTQRRWRTVQETDVCIGVIFSKLHDEGAKTEETEFCDKVEENDIA